MTRFIIRQCATHKPIANRDDLKAAQRYALAYKEINGLDCYIVAIEVVYSTQDHLAGELGSTLTE